MAFRVKSEPNGAIIKLFDDGGWEVTYTREQWAEIAKIIERDKERKLGIYSERYLHLSTEEKMAEYNRFERELDRQKMIRALEGIERNLRD